MPIRVECSIPGLETNWVEVDDVWTRRELQLFTQLSGDEYWELWSRKVKACHIVIDKERTVTQSKDVPSSLDDLDIRLLRWLASSVLVATQHLLNLGEKSARLSSNGVEIAVQKTN